MPARSNAFQRLVFLIQTQLASSSVARVTESKMLGGGRDGEEREADVVVEFTQHGAPFVLSLECRDTSRPLTKEHVEQLLKKHEARSDKLIIVSRRGFTKGAANLARLHRAEAVTLEAAENVDWSAYVETFDGLRLGLFTLKIEKFDIDHLRPADQGALDVTRPCEFANARGRASLHQYMSELVQRDEIKVPVMDAWFAVPPDQRTDSFSFKFAYKPTEPLLILQDGASFPVVAIRGEASAKVSTGKLELSPISFMKTNMLHGTAQMPGNPAGDPVQMVITLSAQPGIANVSMLFPPTNKKGRPEIAKGLARFRKT